MGGQKITGNLGDDYRDHLVEYLARGKRGSADLCAYFFLRVEGLLRAGGQCGLIATNTLAQGDTREVGLDQMTANGCVILRAVPSRKWPGTANLEVAHVWLRKGPWNSTFHINDKATSGVTSLLTEPGIVSGPPKRLSANSNKSFTGSYVLGRGFFLDAKAAERLIGMNPNNGLVLMSHLNGEDLNSRPDLSPGRLVINFFDWPLDRKSAPEGYDGFVAADFPDCLSIVESTVKPQRLAQNDQNGRKYWWRFMRTRPELHSAIANMNWVLPISSVSKHPAFAPVQTGIVFDHNLTVLAMNTWEDYCSLNSRIHLEWASEYSSTLETRTGYRPSDCLETFPFPAHSSAIRSFGKAYDEHRSQIMLSRQEGLTKTYNRFHDSAESADDIQYLRELHVEMDRAVWSPLTAGPTSTSTTASTRPSRAFATQSANLLAENS